MEVYRDHPPSHGYEEYAIALAERKERKNDEHQDMLREISHMQRDHIYSPRDKNGEKVHPEELAVTEPDLDSDQPLPPTDAPPTATLVYEEMDLVKSDLDDQPRAPV